MITAAVSRLDIARVTHLAGQPQQGTQAFPQLFKAEAKLLLNGEPLLQEEGFGPVSVVIERKSHQQLTAALRAVRGQVTINLLAEDNDLVNFAGLVPIIEQKSGHLLVNGYPTRVDVCDAMIHGGPYPATSDSRGTSVGTPDHRTLPAPCLLAELSATSAAGSITGQ